MNIQLHRNARTMPTIHRELQHQPPSMSNQELAETYDIANAQRMFASNSSDSTRNIKGNEALGGVHNRDLSVGLGACFRYVRLGHRFRARRNPTHDAADQPRMSGYGAIGLADTRQPPRRA